MLPFAIYHRRKEGGVGGGGGGGGGGEGIGGGWGYGRQRRRGGGVEGEDYLHSACLRCETRNHNRVSRNLADFKVSEVEEF